MDIEKPAYEIRITTNWTDDQVIINKCVLPQNGNSYILAKEKGSETNKEHFHLLLYSDEKTDTIRKRIGRNYPGNERHSMKKCKSDTVYLRYIHKEYTEDNLNILTNLEVNHQHWKDEWSKNQTIAKCRNKDTQSIVEELLSYEKSNPTIIDTYYSDVIKVFIKHNGLFPNKVYFNQVIRTVQYHTGKLNACNAYNFLWESIPIPLEPN